MQNVQKESKCIWLLALAQPEMNSLLLPWCVESEGKQPKDGNNPNVHQQMNGKTKMVHKCNGILLSFKRKDVLTHVTTCMNLEDIMPNEISLSQKDKYCRIPLM